MFTYYKKMFMAPIALYQLGGGEGPVAANLDEHMQDVEEINKLIAELKKIPDANEDMGLLSVETSEQLKKETYDNIFARLEKKFPALKEGEFYENLFNDGISYSQSGPNPELVSEVEMDELQENGFKISDVISELNNELARLRKVEKFAAFKSADIASMDEATDFFITNGYKEYAETRSQSEETSNSIVNEDIAMAQEFSTDEGRIAANLNNEDIAMSMEVNHNNRIAKLVKDYFKNNPDELVEGKFESATMNNAIQFDGENSGIDTHVVDKSLVNELMEQGITQKQLIAVANETHGELLAEEVSAAENKLQLATTEFFKRNPKLIGGEVLSDGFRIYVNKAGEESPTIVNIKDLPSVLNPTDALAVVKSTDQNVFDDNDLNSLDKVAEANLDEKNTKLNAKNEAALAARENASESSIDRAILAKNKNNVFESFASLDLNNLPKNGTPEAKDFQQQLVDAGYDLGNYGPSNNGVDGNIGTKSIKALQMVLVDAGFDVGNTGADGRIGPKTTKAFLAFQSVAGSNADVAKVKKDKIEPTA